MPKQKRTVVVTGANGFVGRHVIERLLKEKDIRVRAMVRETSDLGPVAHLRDKIDIVHGDITNPRSLQPAFKGAWGVINVAGHREFWSRNPKRFYHLNERGARNVFEAALICDVKKVVQVSTPLAFGRPDDDPFNEDSAAGEHPSDYAKSKYLGDCAGRELMQSEGLPLAIVYLAAVIGAGDDKATMEVKRALDKKMPALIGADTEFTYVHVRDAAEAIVRTLLSDKSVGRSYLIGESRATTREYFEKIGRIAGVPVPRTNIPEKLLMPVARGLERASRFTGTRPMLPLDVLKTTAAGSLLFDCRRSKEELGMNYTSLDQALAEAIAYVRQVS